MEFSEIFYLASRSGRKVWRSSFVRSLHLPGTITAWTISPLSGRGAPITAASATTGFDRIRCGRFWQIDNIRCESTAGRYGAGLKLKDGTRVEKQCPEKAQGLTVIRKPLIDLAEGQGFEPWLTGPEPVVLPLDDPSKKFEPTF
jgi:hypothetical protein